MGPALAELSVDGVKALAPGPRIISNAISPFSAVETLQPRRERSRFINIRVNGSSSTTKTSRPGSKAGLVGLLLEAAMPNAADGEAEVEFEEEEAVGIVSMLNVRGGGNST